MIQSQATRARSCTAASPIAARRFSYALLLLAVCLPAWGNADEQGWTVLFDGKTLDGWIQKNGTATYRIENETIVGKTNEGSPNSFLCTEKDYGDFELMFEVKCDNRLNSGVQIRSQTRPVGEDSGDKFGRVNGPQVEIEAANNEGSLSGYVYGEATGRGWLSSDSDRVRHAHYKNEKWNRYHVIAKGNRIQTFINGFQIADLTDEEIYKTHPKGFIGLQVHGIASGAGPYEVAWRNIKIRELSAE